MSNSLMLASIVGPFYLVMGLSVLLYAKQWQKIMKEFMSNHLSMLGLMCFTLTIGLIMVNMHNIWKWDLYIIITLTGWGALIKGVFYFLAPGSWLKSLLKCKCYQSETFLMFWGLVVSVLGVVLSYYAYLV